MHMFEFEDLEIFNDRDDKEPKLVSVRVYMKILTVETPPSGQYGPPEFYDPGCGAEWFIDEIVLGIPDSEDVIRLHENQFIALFPNGQDIVNNAFEYASEQ